VLGLAYLLISRLVRLDFSVLPVGPMEMILKLSVIEFYSPNMDIGIAVYDFFINRLTNFDVINVDDW
jgi:hypothetical protein